MQKKRTWILMICLCLFLCGCGKAAENEEITTLENIMQEIVISETQEETEEMHLRNQSCIESLVIAVYNRS